MTARHRRAPTTNPPPEDSELEVLPVSRAITETVIEAIQRRYAAGEALNSIAENEHVSRSTVQKYTRDLPRRVQQGHYLTPETVSEVKDLTAKGFKQRAIARKLNISVTTVRRYQRANDTKPPRRGRPRKTAADLAR
jgi:DNA invertase Pin-like site-specific DNA recombinase